MREEGESFRCCFILTFVRCFSLIGTLLLGYLDDSGIRKDEDESRSYLPSSATKNGGFQVPAARAPRNVPSMLPKDDDDDEADIDPLGN